MSYLKQFQQDLLTAETYYILDTETTGLHDGEICQIAIIDNHGTIHLDTYVRTKEPIPASVSAIHGILDSHVKKALTWKELQPTIADILRGKKVVIYNAVYDRKMMHKSAERWGLEHYDWKEHSEFYCAMEAYAEYNGNWNDYYKSYRWVKLSEAAQVANCVQPKAHTALADCIMTLGVVTYLLSLPFADKEESNGS